MTERREAQPRVLESESDLRSVLEVSPGLIARFDREPRHLYVNPVVERVLVVRHRGVVRPGRDAGELVGDAAAAAMYRAKRDGRARYEFFEAQSPDGPGPAIRSGP